jgi:predicted nucleic acid-binding protein
VNRVFVDTSAILALLLATDDRHRFAKKALNKLSARQAVLVTTSYVLVETYALLARRIGIAAVRNFREDFAPLLDVIWVDRDLHERALDLLIQRSSSRLSLVDATSFLAARGEKIDDVFAYDRDFEKEGFNLVG